MMSQVSEYFFAELSHHFPCRGKFKKQLNFISKWGRTGHTGLSDILPFMTKDKKVCLVLFCRADSPTIDCRIKSECRSAV